MLPDVVAEVIHSLPRTDLDKLWWFGTLIAKTFKVYPLRRVHSVVLTNGFDKNEKRLRLTVSAPAPSGVEKNGAGLAFGQTFDNVVDALTLIASLVPHTSFNKFLIYNNLDGQHELLIPPAIWASLFREFRSGELKALPSPVGR